MKGVKTKTTFWTVLREVAQLRDLIKDQTLIQAFRTKFINLEKVQAGTLMVKL